MASKQVTPWLFSYVYRVCYAPLHRANRRTECVACRMQWKKKQLNRFYVHGLKISPLMQRIWEFNTNQQIYSFS